MSPGEQHFEVRAGDVFVFNGGSLISKAIRFFDGADVNHAALAIDGATMIEAAGDGLRTRPIKDALKTNNFTAVLRLPDERDFGPVVKTANTFLANKTKYAYQQIVLLAILCVTRRVEIGNRLLRWVVRRALEHAAGLINALIEHQREMMICSEFVYRSYADSNDPRYALTKNDEWRSQIALDAAATTSVMDWARAQANLTAVPQPAGAGIGAEPDLIAKEAEAELEPLIAAYLAEKGVENVPAGMITPMAVDEIPDVSDDELHVAAIQIRDSWLRLQEQRGDLQPAGLGDAWNWFANSIDANFVTPGDLQHMTPLKEVERITP
jgi:hypothetical protein